MSSEGSKGKFRLSSDILQAVGKAVAEVDAALQGWRSLSVDVTGINIRAPQADGGEVLCIIKGRDAEGTPCVAFHSAFDTGEALRGVASRLANGTLKWRVDDYYVQK